MGRRPFLQLLMTAILVVLTLATAPSLALATAPLASAATAGAPGQGPRVLWHGSTPVVLRNREGGAFWCIASDPDGLAFALGYLAGQQMLLPGSRVREAAGADRLAALTAPPAEEVQTALEDWSASRIGLLSSVAAGLNLSDREAGLGAVWTPSGVAGLAAQPRALRRLLTGGAAPRVGLAGPAAAAGWGPALVEWVGVAIFGEDRVALAPQAGAAPGSEIDAADLGSGGLLWVQLRVAESGQAEFRLPGKPWWAATLMDAPRPHWQTPIGPVLWTDDGFSLGLVYVAPDWREGLAQAGAELDRLMGVSPVLPET